MNNTDTRQDTEVIDLTEFEFAPPCESHRCDAIDHKPAHEADWVVLLSCGCTMLWCNDRFIKASAYYQKSGWHCSRCARCGYATGVENLGLTVLAWSPVNGS